LFDANEEHVLPMLLLGGIATFQASLFVLWRAFAGSTAPASLAKSGEGLAAVGPSYLRAAVVPSLAIAALFLLLIADVQFALPVARSYGGISPKMIAYRGWHEALLITAVVVVPVCLLGLTMWRAWGPRIQRPDGSWSVPMPFVHPAWLWTAGVLAGLSLFLPWFRLELIPKTVTQISWRDGTSTFSFTPDDAAVKDIAGMPSGWRYAHRGLQSGSQAAAAAMLIFALFMSGYVFGPHHSGRAGRIIFLLVFGSMSLLIWNMQVHRGADQHRSIVIDATTAEGIALHSPQPGGAPAEEWRRVLTPAIVARPSFGAYALLAACGLAIFMGVTEFSWGSVGTQAAGALKAEPAAAKPAVDPAREAIRRRVAGPAIGLMIAGAIGLLPLVLAALAVPAVAVVPNGPSLQPEPAGEREAPAVVPKLMIPLLPTIHSPAIVAYAPVILAAEEGYVETNLTPMWGVLMIAVLLLVSLPISLTLIIGGWRMRQLKSYGLAMIAAVLAILPCDIAWPIGVPIGIWALVVLRDPAVREAFES
jgi:hypothetical protein